MPELDSAISAYLEKWGESSVERNNTYSIESNQIEEDQIPELIEDIETLAESFNPGSFEIDVDGGEDQYNIDSLTLSPTEDIISNSCMTMTRQLRMPFEIS